VKTKKSKVFARVIALALALVMAATSSISALAAGFNANRADKAATVGKNWVDWVDLLNEDACEALLDAADQWLHDLDLTHVMEGSMPLEMDLTSFNDVIQNGSMAYVYLGRQQNANGKYYTSNGGYHNKSMTYPNEVTTVPARNRVYVHAQLYASALLVVNIRRSLTIEGYADSVDGIIDIIQQLYTHVIGNGDLNLTVADARDMILGDQLMALDWSALTNLSYNTTGSNSACGKNYRSKNGAKAIVKAIATFLDTNLYVKNNSNNLIYNLLQGTLSLGALNDMVGLYYKGGDGKTAQEARNDGIIGGLIKGDKVSVWNEYETNGYLLYNALATYVMNHELPTTDGPAYYGIDANGNALYAGVPTGDSVTGANARLTKATYKYYGSNTAAAWNYDKVIMDCISRYVLQNININVTYPEYVQNEDGEWVHDSAQARFKDNRKDSKLEYNKDGNVYLFRYNGEKLWFKETDNLYDFAMRALKMAWNTALKPTLHLVQVNYNGHEIDGKGTNFDNAFLKWYIENKATGDVRSFPATAYTDGSVDEWAAAVYADYGAADAAEFLENVKHTYDYDEARKAKNDKYNWRDIDVTSLFNQVRYSPLADKYFNVRTGPANLYFLQTGTANMDAFMDAVAAGTKTYAGIPEALNDFLIEAVKDIFPNSANIGYNNVETGVFENIAAPSGFTASTTFNAKTIMNNIYKVLEYVANTTNANILNPYYAVNSITYNGTAVNLNAGNIEAALIPFGIAVLKQWNLTAVIHNSDWDKVSDLESAAVVALKEYLGYLFPDRDYSSLWKEVETPIGDTGVSYKLIKAKNSSLYNEAILLMARDAAAYVVVATGTPVTKLDSNRTPWDPYTMSALNDTSTTIWDLANAVGCYFLASSERFDKAGTNAKSKGIAALFGLKSSIKSTNTVWANLDAIFNRILPVGGELQYKYTNKDELTGAYNANGAFDSQEFIENILIADVFDFNLTNLFDGIYRILSARPIKTTAINKVLYTDILAPVVNSILGANPSNSAPSGSDASKDIIPATDSATPFDAFLLPSTIVAKYGTYRGVLNALIHNLALYLNGGGASDDFYNVGTFALMTLGMPGQLKQHELGGVDIKVFDSDVYSTSPSTTIKVRNNSYGINRFFHNQGDLNASKQHEASRYWVKLKSVAIQNASGTNVKTLSLPSNTTIAPENSVYYDDISWTGTRDTLYKVVVTYDVLFDDTLTNGTATTAAAPTKTVYSNAVATKWIYDAPSSYTQSWSHQSSKVYSGNGISSDAPAGTTVTGTKAQNMTIKVGSLYDVTASNVASEGYGLNINNSASAAITGKFYVTPLSGMAYNNKTSGAAATVPTNTAPALAFLAIDEKGNIYNKDGGVYGTFDDLKSNAWIAGYHKTTNLEGKEVYDYILANAWNTPAEVAFGAPGAGTVIADVTSLEKGDNSFALFKSGATLAAKYNVGFAFAISASARAVASPATIAYCGDMDALQKAVDNYADVAAAQTAVQNGAKAACIRYRNSTNYDAWVNADALAKAIYDAGEAAVTARAAQITDYRFGENGLDNLDEVDYKIVGHREFRKYLEKYEKKLVATPVVELDEAGEPKLDEDGNEIPVLDAKGRPTYTYKAEMPQIIVDELARTLGLYKGYMEERAHDLTRINAEIKHATSPCDTYDEVEGTGFTVSDFSATATTAERYHVVLDENGVPVLDENDAKSYEKSTVGSYRFAYSTKKDTEADNVKVYEVSSNLADGTAVKFGAIKGGKLVNEGTDKFDTNKWNAYIDALGEVITSINAGDPISKTYTATTHLVMAENELEPIDEPISENITVSGRVLIAGDAVGTATNFGLRGVVVYAVDGDNNVVAQTESNSDGDKATWGNFTLEVPAGTTQLYVGNPSAKDTIVNRGFTIAGDANVENANVAVVMCDYNDDGGVNVIDNGSFSKIMKGDYNIYADFNNDGGVNVIDKGIFSKILKNGSRIVYAEELAF